QIAPAPSKTNRRLDQSAQQQAPTPSLIYRSGCLTFVDTLRPGKIRRNAPDAVPLPADRPSSHAMPKRMEV
ncbi:hypothetical protein, partial [Aurantimonas sp. C2-3-R2]|uniref:hypothetical protein n=1 Tax=Aurantimonas sp. C2-3-R2 TaxID=3114363 RepID=UPI002E18BC3B|nr:hypothetical protein [Aurantimonas sp. C2-3-R2]